MAWDWAATGVVVSGAVSLAALGVSIWSAAAGKRTAERAEDAASRSAAAAERSAAAHERSVELAEGSVHQPQVHWGLRHHAGDRYVLENTGDAVAFAVDVDVDAHVSGDLQAPRLRPGETVDFMATRTMNGRTGKVTVSWQPEDNARFAPQTWTALLPAKR